MSSIGFEEYDPTLGRTVAISGPDEPMEETEQTAEFTGGAGELADLAIRTTMLTILTLGIYRFWMRTNLRRYYWSAIRADGEPLEYTGKGSELFMGFLLAMVVLAIYLTVVTFGLTYIGIEVLQQQELVSLVAAFSVLPLVPMAIYRARRYLLSRTRWRGIRFGVESGSWGYTIRYFIFGALTLLSVGLLYPLMQFQLAKFAANRTWFGNLRMTQGGGPLGLFAVWVPTLIAMLVGIGGSIVLTLQLMATLAATNPETQESAEAARQWLQALGPYAQHPLVATLAPFSPLPFFAAIGMWMWYQVFSFRYLTTHKYFGDREIRFRSKLGFWQVAGIYFTGTFLTFFVMLGVMMLIGAIVVGGLFATGVGLNLDIAALESGGGGLENSPIAGPLILIGSILGYLILILVLVACVEVFFTRRLLAKACRTLTIYNIERARAARQRVHDSNIEGQGFADALDIGGAI